MFSKSLHVGVICGKRVFLIVLVRLVRRSDVQLSIQLLFLQWDQRLSSWEPARSVASPLDGLAVFAETVSGQGFSSFWVSHGG